MGEERENQSKTHQLQTFNEVPYRTSIQRHAPGWLPYICV